MGWGLFGHLHVFETSAGRFGGPAPEVDIQDAAAGGGRGLLTLPTRSHSPPAAAPTGSARCHGRSPGDTATSWSPTCRTGHEPSDPRRSAASIGDRTPIAWPSEPSSAR